MTGPLLAAAVYGILTRWPRPVNARPAAHPRTARALWTLILAAAVVLERYGMNRPGQGWTLSEVTRKAWRTDTTLGAWIFRGWWLLLAGWLPGHIVAWRHETPA